MSHGTWRQRGLGCILTWSDLSEFPLDHVDQVADVQGRTAPERGAESVIEERRIPVGAVQFCECLIQGPAWETGVEDLSFLLRVSRGAMGCISGL